MGLITQIDDQMGVLMKFLEARGLLDTTMIVFTSDHGDYLGDHWMGEKDLFHEQSAKIPLIVIDPSAEADATRGTVSDALVEAIDLAPTFVDYSAARRRSIFWKVGRCCRCCAGRRRAIGVRWCSRNMTTPCRMSG